MRTIAAMPAAPLRQSHHKPQGRKVSLVAVVVHFLLLLFALWVLAPLIVMLTTSFKPAAEIFELPPHLLPQHWTFTNYISIFTTSSMPSALVNSALTGALVAAIAMSFGGSAGYALARFRFRGSRGIALGLLAGQLVPEAVLLLPLYEMVARLHLIDTIPGLALAQVATVFPIVVWMSRSAIQTVPVDLEESAQVDGSTRLGGVIRVVLPIAAPSLAAITIFAFLMSWNEFLLASVITLTNASQTGPVALTDFATQFTTNWGTTMAASVVLTLPVAIFFLFLQRYFVSGLSAGAVKG